MGFSSFHNATPNPAQRYYKWSGGYKEEVKLPDGGTAAKISGRLTYWDRDAGENGENVVVDLPFAFCALEQTRSITGFSPTPGSDIRYFSNETVDNDEIMVVQRQDSTGTHEILRGRYADIKEKLPQGAKLQINLYMYNPHTSQVERLNLSGSSLSEFVDFSKKHSKLIYDHMMYIDTSGVLKKTGTVDYMPPKFEVSGEPYTNEEMAKLSEEDAKVLEYMKYRREQNSVNNGTSEVVGNIDQTPVMYAGEENQETGEASESIDLTEIPF